MPEGSFVRIPGMDAHADGRTFDDLCLGRQTASVHPLPDAGFQGNLGGHAGSTIRLSQIGLENC